MMKTVVNRMPGLTRQELDRMEEQMIQEKLMVRKFKIYAESCTDPQLKQKCEQVAARHHEHYIRLLNQLS